MGWCRHPRTTQELRQLHGARTDYREDEDIPLVRSRRRNIPTWYDDRPVAANEIRNWKRHRKTQWKPKELPKEKKPTKFRGYSEVSTRWGWKGKQRFKKRRVWSWIWTKAFFPMARNRTSLPAIFTKGVDPAAASSLFPKVFLLFDSSSLLRCVGLKT